MALRGTFLVGPRPADADLVRRFILCAAESGIDVFRLHDPLNDVDDLEGPIAAVREAGRPAARGPVLQGRRRGAAGWSSGRGKLVRARRRARAAARPCRRARPGRRRRADRPHARGLGHPRRPVHPGPRRHRARGGDRGRPCRCRPDRHGLLPHRHAHPAAVPAELLAQALRGLRLEHGLDREVGWEVARRIESEIGDAAGSRLRCRPRSPCAAALTPAGRARRRHRAPPGGRRRRRPARRGARRGAPRPRATCGSPPPAAPVGRILATQAIQHVLGRAAGPMSTRRCAGCCSASTATRRVPSTRPRAPSPRRRRPRPSRRPLARAARRRGGHARGVRGGALPGRAVRRERVPAAREPARAAIATCRARRRGGRLRGRAVQRLIGMLEESDLARAEPRGRRRPHHAAEGRPAPAAGRPRRRSRRAQVPRRPRPTTRADNSVIRVESPMVGHVLPRAPRRARRRSSRRATGSRSARRCASSRR